MKTSNSLRGSLLTIFLFTCSVFDAYSQTEFITIWKPSGTSTNQFIALPIIGTGMNISWEEIGYPAHSGTAGPVTDASTALSSATVVNFGVPLNPTTANATYRVKVTGALQRYYALKANTTSDKLMEIKQWGSSINWTSMAKAFYACTNVQLTATDVPKLTVVTSMDSMFASCTSFTGSASMNSWNTSSVTDMSDLFRDASVFNANIGSWNTAKVKTMECMFMNSTLFNQNIGSWTTALVENMRSLFESATSFNQNIGSWNTANATNMAQMFSSAKAFNQGIANWSTSKVTAMNGMFAGASAFNQSIANWNTTAVINMATMFASATAFNQPIGNWSTGNVTDMNNMFAAATVFNQNLNNWGTSKVKDMNSMFSSAIAFNQNITSWNTAAVTNMATMFSNAKVFNQAIGNWNTANVTDMNGMFASATAFDQSLNNWNTSKVKDMSRMFSSAIAFNQNITGWNTVSVTKMATMFANAKVFNQAIGNWNTGNVTDMNGMFTNATAFDQTISSWNTSKVKTMNDMFSYATAFNKDIRGWNTSAVTNMSQMFFHATAFDQSLGSWDLRSITKNAFTYSGLYDMFNASNLSCANYSQTLIGWANNSSTAPNLDLGNTSPLKYNSAASSSRTTLTANKGWKISGDVYRSDCSIVVPVKFLYFTAFSKNNKVLLEWGTATEMNNLGFEIERSRDGNTWEKIGSVPTQATYGNSTADITYSFTDNGAYPNTNYYRLKQLDIDGKYEYSNIRMVDQRNSAGKALLYPNPVKNVLMLEALTKGTVVEIVNFMGQVVKTRRHNNTSVMAINVSSLRTGIYFVRMTDEKGDIKVQKIIKE